VEAPKKRWNAIELSAIDARKLLLSDDPVLSLLHVTAGSGIHPETIHR
jgi:hypothetical protein